MKNTFKPSEIVMALDNGSLFEAKILKIQQIGTIRKYFIHYQKWPRKYDCWIDENMISNPHDKERLDRLTGKSVVSTSIGKKRGRKSKELQSVQVEENIASTESIEQSPEKEKSVSKKAARDSMDEAMRKQKKALLLMEMVDEDDVDINAKVALTLVLKKCLLDEWVFITTGQTKKLLILPKKSSNCVSKILDDFLELKLSKIQDQIQAKMLTDVCESLKTYFDKALPTILLYRQERKQYDLIIGKFRNNAPSELYGGEHLIRFFVRLPRLLTNVFLPASEISVILSVFSEVLKFLDKNFSEYISMTDYAAFDQIQEHVSKMEEFDLYCI